jgi:hypothetical protein
MFWHDAAAAGTIMRAVTGHPHLKILGLAQNNSPDPFAAGAALAALVAANAPALENVDVASSALGNAGLGPLFDALRGNTHLRVLECSNTSMSEAFARYVLLPAVRANTSLRTRLVASKRWGNQLNGQAPPEVLQAEALVAACNQDSSNAA